MSGDDTSSSARKLYGTDLLIGGTIGMEALITALSGCFDMPENCIFPTGDEGHVDAYIDAIGHDNVIALYRLSQEGNLHFNASLDFIAPIQGRSDHSSCRAQWAGRRLIARHRVSA